MVRKDLNDDENILSIPYSASFCGRQQDKAFHRRGTGCRGVRGVSLMQLGAFCWCHKHRVSVLAGTRPLAMVVSFSTEHREECRPAALPSKTMLATKHKESGTVLQPTGGSQGLVFPFSHSPPAKYGIGAETSAPVSSVLAPKDKHDRIVSVTLTLHCQEQRWLLVISAHRLARPNCIFLLHAFLVFIAPMLKS